MRGAPRVALRLVDLSGSELGELGERLAARWLRRQGGRPVARRLRVKGVEVDLLVRLPSHRPQIQRLALVEVKASWRTGAARLGELRYRPGVRLDQKRLQRLRRAARALEDCSQGGPRRATAVQVQVDLVEVLASERGATLEIQREGNLIAPLPKPEEESFGMAPAAGSTRLPEAVRSALRPDLADKGPGPAQEKGGNPAEK